MSDGALRILKPGLLTTVQDLGRPGHQASGVPVAGPMDGFSHRLANQLVGNEPMAATLEITLIGPEMELEGEATMAVSGADFDVWCDGHQVGVGESFHARLGQRLRFGRCRRGARAYLAVAGGIQTKPELGSRATHLVSRMGGLEGRALRAGDRLPIVSTSTSAPKRKGVGLPLPTGGRARVRIMPGPQTDWFPSAVQRQLADTSFRLSPRSNRMGYRLEGPPLLRARDEELISEPVGIGAIQVPNAGEPILLMADRQTAGGYPKIGHVISADVPLAGQLAPGDSIQFEWCTRQEAIAALIARERHLLRVASERSLP
jgi:antagonist of KipI